MEKREAIENLTEISDKVYDFMNSRKNKYKDSLSQSLLTQKEYATLSERFSQKSKEINGNSELEQTIYDTRINTAYLLFEINSLDRAIEDERKKYLQNREQLRDENEALKKKLNILQESFERNYLKRKKKKPKRGF